MIWSDVRGYPPIPSVADVPEVVLKFNMRIVDIASSCPPTTKLERS